MTGGEHEMTRVPYVPPPLPASIPQRDLRRDERFDVPADAARAAERAPAAYPERPRIVSSAHGPISHVLLWYPEHDPGEQPWFGSVYADLLRALPQATRVTLVVHPSVMQAAERLVEETRPSGSSDLVTAPDWIAFTVWAEDAFAVVEDLTAEEPTTYLLEPADFPRAGDEFLAEFVAQAGPVQATQVPLVFQGGNILIGDDFILIGRDYLDDSVRSAQRQGALADFPYDGDAEQQERFVADLFRRLFDPDREVHFLDSNPGPRQGNRLFDREGGTWFEDIERGSGQRQPIFHIDMFVSLAGPEADGGPYRVLVGDPRRADDLLGWDSVDHDLHEEFDAIAAQLEGLGFAVQRTPLPYLYADIAEPSVVHGPDGEPIPIDGSRLWYHATANNCLVQIDGSGRDVWLPTYGHGALAGMAVVDDEHSRIWEAMGFTVHRLGDFHPFAFNLGALHCIKKYLAR
jgi:hypothetical protein